MNVEDDDRTVLRDDTGGSVASSETTAPRILKERFILETKIGAGGMGTVFRAKDLRKVEARDRHPYVAVKVLNNEFREHRDAFVALQREASKSQALSHPNIVSIFDFDKDGDIPFMTMELLEGEELAELLKRHPTGLPADMAWRIIDDICAGLRHAHEAGVVHADFKPGNVFITNEGTAKVLDFGIARAAHINRGPGDDTLFDPASLAALTPAYASKEMLIGEMPEAADDVYALGVVTYLILTGSHPFNRMRADEAELSELTPLRPRGLNASQWAALTWALRFNRDDRPVSAAAFAEKLGKPPFLRSRAFAAALAGIVLVGGLAFWAGERERSEARQIAKQEALVEAQLIRLSELLVEPAYDEAWQRQVDDEFARLVAVDRRDVYVAKIRRRVAESYLTKLEAEVGFDEAYAVLGDVDRFDDGEIAARARQHLGERVLRPLEVALAAPALDDAWFEQVETGLDRATAVYGNSHHLAELRQHVADAYLDMLFAAVDDGSVPLAERLLSKFRAREFDADSVADADAYVAAARDRYDAEAKVTREASERVNFEARLAAVLSELSCFRIDLDFLSERLDGLRTAFPRHAKDVDSAAAARIRECLGDVSRVDRERALSLRDDALRRFGPHSAIRDFRIDPCSMDYLIGGGRNSGRSGFCSDRVDADWLGPRLVVIPVMPADQPVDRYAITKYEVSQSEYTRYCQDTKRCEALEGNERLPVTGITAEQADDFAGWLSEQTGYMYRLPTYEEWARAARGDAGHVDPNRNCRVSVSGVERGLQLVASSSGEPNEFGMVNVLGNAQEWVVDGDLLLAVGGAFSDPLEDCGFELARAHDGTADAATGFRLVRELQ